MNLKNIDWQHWALAIGSLVVTLGPNVSTWLSAQDMSSAAATTTRIVGFVVFALGLFKQSPSLPAGAVK
jgi:hypothetical protein